MNSERMNAYTLSCEVIEGRLNLKLLSPITNIGIKYSGIKFAS